MTGELLYDRGFYGYKIIDCLTLTLSFANGLLSKLQANHKNIFFKFAI